MLDFVHVSTEKLLRNDIAILRCSENLVHRKPSAAAHVTGSCYAIEALDMLGNLTIGDIARLLLALDKSIKVISHSSDGIKILLVKCAGILKRFRDPCLVFDRLCTDRFRHFCERLHNVGRIYVVTKRFAFVDCRDSFRNKNRGLALPEIGAAEKLTDSLILNSVIQENISIFRTEFRELDGFHAVKRKPIIGLLADPIPLVLCLFPRLLEFILDEIICMVEINVLTGALGIINLGASVCCLLQHGSCLFHRMQAECGNVGVFLHKAVEECFKAGGLCPRFAGCHGRLIYFFCNALKLEHCHKVETSRRGENTSGWLEQIHNCAQEAVAVRWITHLNREDCLFLLRFLELFRCFV